MNAPALKIIILTFAVSLAIALDGYAQQKSVTGAPQADSAQAVDVLVIAPHPDDEVIGCAGVMLRALEQKKRVAVVLLTSGDAHVPLTAVVAKKPRERLAPDDFKQAGALRQQHSLNAAARLGLAADDLTFLGYPDSGLGKIYHATDGTPFRQMFTHQSETYGITVRDYHSRTHGGAAPYVKSSLHADLVEILRARQPKEVYVTHETDTHGDHSAAFWFVRDALRESGFQGGFFTFLVHGKPPPEPPARIERLTPAQLATKHAALVDHQAGTSPVHDNLASEYAQPEERFWRAQLR